MKLKAAAQRARWRKLNGDLFTFFGYFVAVIGQVGRVDFKIQTAGLCFPHVESGAEVGGEMLVQSWAAFNDGSAAVAQSGTDPGTSPAIAIEEIRRSGMRLVKSRLDALARIERFVAGETAAYRTIKVSAGHGILQPRAYAQPFQAADIEDHISAAGTRRVEVDGKKKPGDADFLVLKAVVPAVRVCVHFKSNLGMKFLLHADFKIVLRIGANVAHTLVRISGIVA